MIINLDNQINLIKDPDLRELLRTIVAALNTQSDVNARLRGDVTVLDPGKGLVMQGDDRNYWRITVTVDNDTPSLEYTKIGSRLPKMI